MRRSASSRPGSRPGESGLFHFKVGENGAPEGKISDYVRTLSADSGDIEVAMLKLCFIDFNEARDAHKPALRCADAIERLQMQHPHTRFVGHAAFDFSRGDERFESSFASSYEYNASFEWIPTRWHRRIGQIARDGPRLASDIRRSIESLIGTDQSEATRALTPQWALLIGDSRCVPALAGSLERLPMNVEIADTADGFPGARSSQQRHAALAGTELELTEWLRVRDSERKYDLILPMCGSILGAMQSLPASDRLRRKAFAARFVGRLGWAPGGCDRMRVHATRHRFRARGKAASPWVGRKCCTPGK
jgi:hypothetical protein